VASEKALDLEPEGEKHSAWLKDYVDFAAVTAPFGKLRAG
jgi:hypothetical protein